MKGSLKDCLQHYAATLPPPGNRQVAEARLPLVRFTGADDVTVQRWTQRGDVPLGENLIRLEFFLDAVGYGVLELETLRALHKEGYLLAELLGFGMLTAQEAAAQLGFPDAHSAFRVARGTCDTSEARKQTIRVLWEHHKEAIDAKRHEFFPRTSRERTAVVRNAPAVAASAVSEAVATVASATESAMGAIADEEIATVAHFLQAALPYLEVLASSAATPNQRKKLRDLMPRNGVFRAANALNKLCGESARNAILAQQGK